MDAIPGYCLWVSPKTSSGYGAFVKLTQGTFIPPKSFLATGLNVISGRDNNMLLKFKITLADDSAENSLPSDSKVGTDSEEILTSAVLDLSVVPDMSMEIDETRIVLILYSDGESVLDTRFFLKREKEMQFTQFEFRQLPDNDEAHVFIKVSDLMGEEIQPSTSTADEGRLVSTSLSFRLERTQVGSSERRRFISREWSVELNGKNLSNEDEFIVSEAKGVVSDDLVLTCTYPSSMPNDNHIIIAIDDGTALKWYSKIDDGDPIIPRRNVPGEYSITCHLLYMGVDSDSMKITLDEEIRPFTLTVQGTLQT
jgi:hypothetical protein